MPGILAAAAVAVVLPAATATAATAKWTMAPPVPVPAAATGSALRDVTVLSQNDVWAVGAWQEGTQAHPLAVHWNGTAWTAAHTPDPPPQDVYGLTAVDGTAPGDVWAVGGVESHVSNLPATAPLLMHYDGTAWGVVPGPPEPAGSQSTLSDVDMRTADDGWAVGRTTVGNLGPLPLILRWQSGQWTRVTALKVGPNAQLTSVFASSADDAWAVGTQLRPGGKQASLVMHWDGVRWTQVNVPDAGGAFDSETLESVAAATPTDVWAAGSTCNTTDLNCTPLVLHLSRGTWQVVPAATGAASLSEVVPFSPTDVWIVGHARTGALSQINHAEHWDGQRFTTEPTVDTTPLRRDSGDPGSARALAAAAGDKASGVLWAVGWSQISNLRIPHVIYRS